MIGKIGRTTMKLRNKKTGEVKKMWKDNICLSFSDCNKVYYSLAELNQEWEDYKPAEPLIKDEKVRKAISSWYDALPIDDLAEKRILFSNGEFCVGIYRIDCGNYVALKDIKERFYTIKELCGEEE